MKVFGILLIALLTGWTEAGRTIQFTNRCGYEIWVAPLTNAQGPPLPGGIPKLANNGQYTFQIPDGGW